MTSFELSGIGRLAGLAVRPRGAVALSGPLLRAAADLDRAFAGVGRAMGAEEIAFTSLLAVEDMRRFDYFTSFPHLVTAPATVDPADAELRAFQAANALGVEGPLVLGKTAPIASILAPAACYAVYPMLEGARLDAPRAFSTVGTCFRNERAYEPLRRQWCFRMREVVHVGDAESARAFLDDARARVLALATRLDLPLTIATATDPFFDPARSPRFAHQKMFPSKHELLFEDLAVGSLNLHRTFFGETFDLRVGDAPAVTACAAFGLERWLWALARRHGADPTTWPSVEP